MAKLRICMDTLGDALGQPALRVMTQLVMAGAGWLVFLRGGSTHPATGWLPDLSTCCLADSSDCWLLGCWLVAWFVHWC